MALMPSQGSLSSMKAQRPKPPWLLMAGTQSVRASPLTSTIRVVYLSPIDKSYLVGYYHIYKDWECLVDKGLWRTPGPFVFMETQFALHIPPGADIAFASRSRTPDWPRSAPEHIVRWGRPPNRPIACQQCSSPWT
jgi:hypothetical protein